MKSSSSGIFSDSEVADFPSFSQAVRTSMYGRPGACYVDIAGDMVNAKVDRSKIRFIMTCFWFYIFIYFPAKLHLSYSACFCRVVSCCPDPPVSLADHSAVAEAISVLKTATRPLVIIGKGSIT